MIDNIRDLLVLHEDRRAQPYYDSLGFATVGIGHLIDPRKKCPLPEHIIDALFYWDLKVHKDALFRHQPWVATLDPVRQAVLIDMTFNMGEEPFDNDNIKDWPNFLDRVRTARYASAAQLMRSTVWATQVKGRAERLAKMMETGQWPEK